MAPTVRPRIVLCALGPFPDWRAVDEVIARVAGPGTARDAEYSQLEPDPRMRAAFEASADRVTPSFSDEDDAAIDAHRAVAYVLSPPIDGGTEVAATMLRLGAALLDEAGAVALKCESSGIAHGAARWRHLAAEAAGDDPDAAGVALYHAWVRRPLGAADGTLYSCGMHLLGARDAELAPDAASDELDAVAWLDALNLYALLEPPARGISDGEGFRREAGGERRVIRLVECTRYATDDFFYNPYGLLRLARR